MPTLRRLLFIAFLNNPWFFSVRRQRVRCAAAQNLCGHLMQQAGMSNGDILLAATQTAAEAIGLDKDLGSLATGKVADLLISTQNPLQDLASLQHPAWVFHDGIAVVRPPQAK